MPFSRFPIKVMAYFSSKVRQARGEWADIVKSLKERNCQPEIQDSARLLSVSGDKKRPFKTNRN